MSYDHLGRMYDQDEMDDFLEMVRFDRMTREVTHIVTTAYRVEQQCTHCGKEFGLLYLDFSALTNPAKKLDPFRVLILPVQECIDRSKDFLTVTHSIYL